MPGPVSQRSGDDGTCEICRISPRAYLCSECLSVVCPHCWNEYFEGCRECAMTWRRSEKYPDLAPEDVEE